MGTLKGTNPFTGTLQKNPILIIKAPMLQDLGMLKVYSPRSRRATRQLRMESKAVD